MPKIDVLNLDGEKMTTRELPDAVFGEKDRPLLIAHAVRYYRTRMRGSTAAVRTRAMVRGSGRKIYAQKHTGRARHADAQAPQFRGGGRAHGPKPHRASIRFPHRLRRLALRIALSGKLRDGRLRLLDLQKLDKPATGRFAGFPRRAGFLEGRVLFVFEPEARLAYQSVRNLPDVRTQRALSLTAYDVLATRNLVLTEKAADLLARRLTEKSNG